jgi:hypothetical protein
VKVRESFLRTTKSFYVLAAQHVNRGPLLGGYAAFAFNVGYTRAMLQAVVSDQ